MDDRPVLRIVRGDPSDDELAALIAVVAARASGSGESTPRTKSAWNDPLRLVREPVFPGPGGWTASARPR
jgi:hypothetical protein